MSAKKLFIRRSSCLKQFAIVVTLKHNVSSTKDSSEFMLLRVNELATDKKLTSELTEFIILKVLR